jgi:hypothetical protein
MAIEIPDFDFSSYHPKDPWHFPAQRIVRVAAELYAMATAARQQCALHHLHPDQRYVVHHAQCGLAHALLLGAMHMRSHGSDPAWWESQAEITHAVEPRLIQANNMGLRQLLHLGYAQGMLRQLDMAMRQYAHALLGGSAAKAGLGQVWRDVMGICGLQQYDMLLRLWQVHRDSLSQLGKFYSEDGKDLQIQYQGRMWQFVHRAEIDHAAMGCIDDWDFLRLLATETHAMLHALHAHPHLAAIPMIPCRYLD